MYRRKGTETEPTRLGYNDKTNRFSFNKGFSLRFEILPVSCRDRTRTAIRNGGEVILAGLQVEFASQSLRRVYPAPTPHNTFFQKALCLFIPTNLVSKPFLLYKGNDPILHSQSIPDFGICRENTFCYEIENRKGIYFL